MKKELFIEKCQSKKDSTKTYVVLKCNTGFRDIVLSFDNAIIAEISYRTFEDLYNMQVGEKYVVGTVGV